MTSLAIGPIALGPADLALAAALILLNGIVSIVFKLGLERSLALAALRMVVQLGLIGFVLKFIFEQSSPLWTIGLATAMVLIAGQEAVARQNARRKGWLTHGLATLILLLTCTLATLYAVGIIIGPSPWYAPRYLLPLLGMMLGNALTGVALTLDALTGAAERLRGSIETRLALGDGRFQAMAEPLTAALRTGIMPIINAMSVSGIVALPGMMTGQILAGADPVEATKYQIVIMFLIASSTALAVLAAGLGGVLLLTDERHRLRLDRLERRAQA